MIELTKFFIQLIIKPKKTINLIQHQSPPIFQFVKFLLAVGFLRGLFDIPWIYWQAGQLPSLSYSLVEPTWYLLNIGPFILTEIVTIFLRWVLFAGIVHGLAYMLEARGLFRSTLNAFGVILAITLATILINYLHFIFPIPLIRFSSSPQYNPVIGIGQITTSIWIGFATFQLAKAYYQLEQWPALLIGAFIPLWNTGFFLIVVRILFWILPSQIQESQLWVAFNIGFVMIGLVVLLGLFWWYRNRRLIN